MAWVIADTETTGLVGPACEIALREIDPDTFETIFEIDSLIDPECEIEDGAFQIHGISNAMVANEPTIAEFVEHRLNNCFAGRHIVMIGHNVSFDIKRLHPIGSIVQSICTMQHARKLWPNKEEVANHKLQTLREHFGFPANAAHRALADVDTTQRLLVEIVGRSGRTLRDFAATQDTTIHRMPFGVHRGKLLATLPRSYLEWMKKEMEDPNLKASAIKILKTMGKAA